MFRTAAQEDPRSAAELEDEVLELERHLIAAREKLKIRRENDSNEAGAANLPLRPRRRRRRDQHQTVRSTGDSFAEHHHLLLLSDSALPLGSFAFSSGLESYREHARAAAVITTSTSRRGQHVGSTALHTITAPPRAAPAWSFAEFLPLSLSSYASTTLPFVLAAHRDPRKLAELDDALDAATICTVGRRASCAQGRALLGIWEKSLVGDLGAMAQEGGKGNSDGDGVEAARYSEDETGYESDEEAEEEDLDIPDIIKAFTTLLRHSGSNSTTTATTPASTATTIPSSSIPAVSAHLGPLFGAVSRALGLDAHQTAYIFMLSHVKALVSAAIRGGMFGPFQAQKILAGREVRALLAALIEREWETPVEKAGQSSPVVDLWIGRHEILYSRVFNS